jgi:hypothetical protein
VLLALEHIICLPCLFTGLRTSKLPAVLSVVVQNAASTCPGMSENDLAKNSKTIGLLVLNIFKNF